MLFLLVSLVVISLAFSGANFLAWKLFERPRHALIWSATYALAGLQYTLNLLRDSLPSVEFYWISANLTSFALVILAVWGHRERLGMTSEKRVMIAVFAAVASLSILLTMTEAPFGLRVAMAPTFAFISMSFITSYLLRKQREPQLAQNIAAAVHFLFGLTQGAAAVTALNFGQEISAEATRTYQLINFALMPAFFVAMGISIIFLLATDLSRKLTALSLTDELTQVTNRRGFFEASTRLQAQSQRRGTPLSLILCDVDHFKMINDKYGHSRGDTTLQRFANILLDCVRIEDIVGRIGGEEFAITLAGMGADEAATVAERIRTKLEQSTLVDRAEGIKITASFGIAQKSHESQDIMTLLDSADTALYDAKESGRNKVITAPPAVSTKEALSGV